MPVLVQSLCKKILFSIRSRYLTPVVSLSIQSHNTPQHNITLHHAIKSKTMVTNSEAKVICPYLPPSTFLALSPEVNKRDIAIIGRQRLLLVQSRNADIAKKRSHLKGQSNFVIWGWAEFRMIAWTMFRGNSTNIDLRGNDMSHLHQIIK